MTEKKLEDLELWDKYGNKWNAEELFQVFFAKIKSEQRLKVFEE